MKQTQIDELKLIGDKHSLHIDDIGFIANEIDGVISGKIMRGDFVDRLISGLSDQSIENITSIATDINIKIFGPFRKEVLAVSDDENISRNSILSAIENPTTSTHPISIAQPKPIEKIRPSSGSEVAHDFIGEKLSAPVSLPSQKTTIPPTVAVVKPKPSVDPYRESLS